jgi:hypothetical protein
MYAVPQKINPKNESKSELMIDNKSEKKGMTSAMIQAIIHNAARIAPQAAHPTTVLLPLCRVPSKSRKKINRAETDAYRTPRKIIVGIINENDTFLYTSLPRDPKAGAVIYCVPV